MIIGIDPDIDKSGIAVLHQDTKRMEMSNLYFVDVVKFVQLNKPIIKAVFLEAGWLNEKANWHGASNMSVAAKIGKNVGENHASGKLLQQCIEAEGVKVVLVKPTTAKYTAEMFEKLTKIKGKTNQEQRDAAMLIWGMG